MTRVKICCITEPSAARLAVTRGATAIGLVSKMPSGPGVIPEAEIAEIAAGLPPAVGSFLLTSHTEVEKIVAQQQRCRVNTLQLCARLGPAAHAGLRRALPGIALVQVVHVTGDDALIEAQTVASAVDAILLDSGRPDAATPQLGGTGRIHDWNLSRRIRDSVPVPVFLAGGLHAGNVATAIRRVRPFAVDVCTGVRTGDRLDPVKLDRFLAAVRDAG
jgi:phosphoribosylanthranilate isomerase